MTSTKYWPDTHPMYIRIAEFISDITRPVAEAFGNEGDRGIEISPNKIEYVLEKFAPAFVADAWGMYQASAHGTLTVDEIPIVKAMLHETGGRKAIPREYGEWAKMYYNLREDLKRSEALPMDQQLEALQGIRGRYTELIGWPNGIATMRVVEAEIKKLNKYRRNAIAAGDSERARAIDDVILEVKKVALISAYRHTRGGGSD
jgi:hypothetical protein